MLRLFVFGACATVVAFASGCQTKTSGYCCVTESVCDENGGGGVITPCTDPSAPFCDEQGTYPASHSVGRTCIPDPNQTACSGPSDCTMAGYPYCVDHQCRQCDGAGMGCTASAPVCSSSFSCMACSMENQCAAFSGTPHCGPSGACVECRDGGDCNTDPSKPVCGSSMTCRGCESDQECASNTCDQESGKCVAESNVVYLDPGGATSGTCTKAQPCNSFALGLAQVGGSRNVIKAAAGTYTGQVALSGSSLTVTILGVGATVQPSGLNQSPVVVSNGAIVFIVGLTITGAGGVGNPAGVVCSPGGGGPPSLSLHRSLITQNGGGGVSISGCNFSLINDMIVRNGGSASAFGGVKIDSITSAGFHELRFDTVGGNVGAPGADTGVVCTSVTTLLAFADSIVFGNSVSAGGKQVNGNNCTWSYSDISDGVAGTGNITGDPQFADAANGDYRIGNTSPARDAADPAATEHLDYFGNPRPAGPHDDMGADEVQ